MWGEVVKTITISSDSTYLGEGAGPEDVDALAARIRELCPGAEVRLLTTHHTSASMNSECPEEWCALIDQAFCEFYL